MITRDGIEDLFTAEALAAAATPGGYDGGLAHDSVTGRSMHLEDPDVPLGLADHILEAHSEARARVAKGWEATLANLAQDLWVRCSVLEERLAARR